MNEELAEIGSLLLTALQIGLVKMNTTGERTLVIIHTPFTTYTGSAESVSEALGKALYKIEKEKQQ